MVPLFFDKERNGFVMGEGAGVVILEELEHALKRNAKIYAEVIGYGATSDAYHITSPSPDGNGAKRAMERAIEDAGIKPEEIDYINAHGTSTHLNDLTETLAIKGVFGDKYKDVLVSSTKGNTGHLLGAAGVAEAIFCAKAIQEKTVPATINYKVADEECDLNIVKNNCLKKDINIAMSNSLGFGGHNSCIVMKKWEGYMHGVNLGGWLSQCDHTKDRYDNFIKEEDFKRLSDLKINCVRINIKVIISININ